MRYLAGRGDANAIQELTRIGMMPGGASSSGGGGADWQTRFDADNTSTLEALRRTVPADQYDRAASQLRAGTYSGSGGSAGLRGGSIAGPMADGGPPAAGGGGMSVPVSLGGNKVATLVIDEAAFGKSVYEGTRRGTIPINSAAVKGVR